MEAFFRGSQTINSVTCGFRRSYSQAAEVPSSNVTCKSPRSPSIHCRIMLAFVSMTHSITIFPAAQVEIWFNRITQQAIRRGTFSSVQELVKKIDRYVQSSNAHAQPFVWTATADSILAKVQRLCERISGTEH